MDHPRPWEEDELMDRSSSYRSSVGRSVGAIPSYNGKYQERYHNIIQMSKEKLFQAIIIYDKEILFPRIPC